MGTILTLNLKKTKRKNLTKKSISLAHVYRLAKEEASQVKAPLLTECYANLECKVIDMKMAAKYNLFVLEVLKAWIRPAKKRARMIHHCGKGVFVVDGEIFKLPSKKK